MNLTVCAFIISGLILGCDQPPVARSSAPPPEINRPIVNRTLREGFTLSNWSPLRSLTSSSVSPPPPPTLTEATEGQWRHWVRELADRLEPRTELLDLERKHLFCSSDLDGSYLAHSGDVSPAIKLRSLPRGADHFSLFIFDVDAEPSPTILRKKVKDSPKWNSRTARLLWAITAVDREVRLIPESFGGSGLKLGGKSRPSTWNGAEQHLNDYTFHFTSDVLRGSYFGYDGPCLRWDDPLRRHRVIAIAISGESPSSLDRSQLPSVSHTKLLGAWQHFSAYLLQDHTERSVSPHPDAPPSSQLLRGAWAFAMWRTPK